MKAACLLKEEAACRPSKPGAILYVLPVIKFIVLWIYDEHLHSLHLLCRFSCHCFLLNLSFGSSWLHAAQIFMLVHQNNFGFGWWNEAGKAAGEQIPPRLLPNMMNNMNIPTTRTLLSAPGLAFLPGCGYA